MFFLKIIPLNFKIDKAVNRKFLLLFFFTTLFVFSSLIVNAHVPPVPGATDCGTIQGGVFYSEYYDPPQGTPVSNGACSWVKQGTKSCGTYRYNGVNYTLYNYQFICETPIDNQFNIFGIAAFVLFVFIKSRTLVS